jgi:hypothetical protein
MVALWLEALHHKTHSKRGFYTCTDGSAHVQKALQDMNEIYVPIIVALIGSPLMWFLSRLDKRNTEQHANSMQVLQEIKEDVREAKADIKKHIEWHLDQ